MALVCKPFGDIITFTRASTATYFDSAGVLQSAAIDVPRLDYNPSTLAAQGFLVEESRTNGIRNNTMQGAAAGTPGTSPTNWQNVLVAGLTSSVVGTGTLNGIAYLDVRINGTPSVSSYYNLAPDILVAGASGQTWTGSFWAALVGGSLSNTNANIEIRESDAAQGFLANTLTLLPLTASLTRYSQARTLTNASTAFVSVRFVWQVTAGQPVDFTLRIGLPQLELGAFATSVIPTTTTALTRAADVASVNTLSPWYNATEGTLYTEWTRGYAGNLINFASGATISDGTTSNAIASANTNGANTQLYNSIITGNVEQLTYAFVNSATNNKTAQAFKANDSQFAVNGTSRAADTTCTIPTVSKMVLGGNGMPNAYLNSWLRRVTFYPRRLSQAELEAITA